jgi:hypothetical protein
VSALGFKVSGAPAVQVPAGDAAQLGLHLAVLGPDEEMPRSRGLAEKIAVAISMAESGATALLPLTDSQKADVSVALDAMIDDRAGNLSDSLLALRDACR